MLSSSSRRWIREQPLSYVTACVRRALFSRRHTLWILLVLLLVCIAFQTFVARQARNDKLPGPRHLGFTVNQQQNIWGGLGIQNLRSLHTETASHSHFQNKGNGQTAHKTATGSSKETRSISAFLPKHQNQLSLDSTIKTDSSVKPEPQPPHTPTSFRSHSVNKGATCQPKSHIVFLKTHKTASSTILNILYRYGESRNLTFALPLNKHSQLFYPFFFTSHFVEGVNRRSVKEFHIMCNHMRFRKSEVAKVMPGDSFYFSILRNPVAMMESIFIYYKSIPAFQKTPTLNDFLNNCWTHYNSSVLNNHYAHNILAFDFGFNNNVTADSEDLEERVSRAIGSIEQDFHLILISEYFDESMILLRHALCWSLEDVVSFKLNSRSEQTRRHLLPETAELIKRWNTLDWRIYLHFNSTFWHKVDTLIGHEQMKKDVTELRELQSKLANTCLKDGRAVDPSKIKDSGLKPFQYGAAIIQGYNLNTDIDKETKTQCQRLITPELQYTDHLYTHQFPELSAKQRQATRMDRQHSERPQAKGLLLAQNRRIIRRTYTILKNQSGLLTHNTHNQTSIP